MKTFNFILFSILFYIASAHSAEYKTSLIGSELIPGARWIVKGINDKGQIFGGYEDGQKYAAYLSDTKGGFSFIEEKNHTYQGNHLVANNNGQVVGVWNGGPGNNNFIWSKALGVRKLEIFGTHITPFALNDLGQLIGTYFDYSARKERPFLWDNGVLSDMGEGSEFSTHFDVLGYQVMDIKLTSINNRGELAGYFCYGKYNEKQKKFVRVGYISFFWNGDLHLIQLSSDIEQPEVVKVNNRGVVLLRNRIYDTCKAQYIGNTYLWDIEKGLQPLLDLYGTTLNDSSTVLGYKKEYVNCVDSRHIPAIWKDGCCVTIADLLGVENINNISPPYSDTYTVEGIDEVIEINNKGQIVCKGKLWGESFPCILEPIKSNP